MPKNTNIIPVVTIDGPCGSGKGTVGQLVAQRLGWHFLDSGAVYRSLAAAVLQQQLAVDDLVAIRKLAEELPLEFKFSPKDMLLQVLLAGREITDAIRREECGNVASQIAADPGVRAALLQLQRNFCKLPGLVADGRDMGTVVFPGAELKIFLTATCEERAERRFKQLQAKGIHVSLHTILQELQLRDERDCKRVVAPLQPAVDAIIIDTTKQSINQVVAQVLQLMKDRELVE